MSDVQPEIRPIKKQLKIDIFGCKPEEMSPGDRKTAITGYELRHRIEALVSGITDRKIEHHYHGDGAATAPGMMVLPAIPLSWLFRKRDANVILGYAAHEISHQLETPLDIITSIFADTSKPTQAEMQLKNWWNAVEDYRIEKLTRKSYPGFPILIAETRDHSARRFNEAVEDGTIDTERLGNPYALGAVGLTWIGARLNQYPTTEHDKALSHLSEELRTWVEGWEAALAKVETPQQALDLAKLIMDSLQKEPQEETEKSDKNQAADPDDQQDSDDQNGDEPVNEANNADMSNPYDDNKKPSPSNGKPKTKPETGDKQDENAEGDAKSGDAGDGDAEGDAEGGDAEGEGNDTQTNAQENNAGQHGDDIEQQNDSADQDGNVNPKSSTADVQPSMDGTEQNANNGQPKSSAQSMETADGASEPANNIPAPNVTPEQKEAEPTAADLEIDDIVEQLGQSIRPEDREQQHIDETPAASTHVEVERNEKYYAELRRTLGPSSARSAGVLRRMLQSHDRVRVVRGLEEGRLDLSRLVPIINGSREIYTDRHVNPAINTAVSLLIDNSGSMSGEPLRICQQAAIVLDSAISETGTDLEISGFTSVYEAVVYRYRKFGQKGRQAASTLGGMQNVTLGGTPVALPMLEAWGRLHQHKAPRKLMIVISDGAAADAAQARAVHDLISFQGGIVVGIAIGDARPLEKWCNNVQEIQNIDELPKALTAIVQHVMTQKAR